MLLPVLFEGQVKAVIELASFNRYSEIHTAFLEQLAEGLGVMINAIGAAQRTEVLLKESQTLAAQLQNQQTELQRSNVQLQTQAEALHQSEEQLKAQQEELQQANEELEERARRSANRRARLSARNREIDRARALVEDKAAQLALTSKYKSEFLATCRTI